jgi:F-type H+-transporting ATPase subunit epsilon
MKGIRAYITTLDNTVFDDTVDSITLPGEAGEFGVLHGHSPLITPLTLGEIRAKKNGEEFYMAVSGGMVEVRANLVRVLADQAERADEIDEKLAEDAKKRAEKVMADTRTDDESFAMAEAELKQSLLRIKIVRKHRSRKNI